MGLLEVCSHSPALRLRAELCSVSGAAPSEAPATRWEELRRSRAAPPSTWDEIRQSTSRNGTVAKSNTARITDPRLEGELPSGSVSMTDEVGRRNGRKLEDNGAEVVSDKDAQRMDFEKMMERERRGGGER